MVDLLIGAAYLLWGIYWIFKKEKVAKIKINTSTFIKLIKVLMWMMLPITLFIRFSQMDRMGILLMLLILVVFLSANYFIEILLKNKIMNSFQGEEKILLEKSINKRISNSKIALLLGSMWSGFGALIMFLPQ